MTGRPALVTSYAACPDYSLAGPVTKEESRAALAACLAKGWLQVIGEAALARIADELREGRFLGPVYGLPEVGGVDFTGAGPELWHRYGRLCSPDGSRNGGPPFAFTDVVHCKYTRYFRTQVAALADIEEVRSYDDVVSVTGPSPIGPWRVQWWRRFPEGCRIDIEEKRQWQGRAFGEGQGYCLARSPRKDDARRLRHILDCHNLTLGEWLLLAAMEGSGDYKSASYLPRRVAASANLSATWRAEVGAGFAFNAARSCLSNRSLALPPPVFARVFTKEKVSGSDFAQRQKSAQPFTVAISTASRSLSSNLELR
jgi:hypothetical protein